MQIKAFSSYAATMPVSAVHYRDDGTPVGMRVMLPASLGREWREIQECNCMISTEMTPSGLVRIAIAHPAGGDYISELTKVGPGIRHAVVRLIQRWDATQFRIWLAKALGGDGDA